MVAADVAATLFIIFSGAIGLLFAAYNAFMVSRVRLDQDMRTNLVNEDGLSDNSAKVRKVVEISEAISEGANSFLMQEYKYLAIFMVLFAAVIVILLGIADDWIVGVFSALAFVLGGCTSIVSGFIGMKIAVYANSRTALEARSGIGRAFVVAFKSGLVMGFCLVSLGMLILLFAIGMFKLYFKSDIVGLYESIAGYGLGGSSIALFGRVGGGIYTKAADVGADLVGKVEKGIPEDDPRNPATIADNVGDNVGDIAGMGADLFGSLAESTCAALVLTAKAGTALSWSSQMFPLTISAAGILVCIITSFFATHIKVVAHKTEIEPSLKRQLLISTFLTTPVIYLLAALFLPSEFVLEEGFHTTNWKVFLCVISGLWAGLVIGYVTEYFTSHAYRPVRDVANACETGAATNVIYGLALGFKSAIIPVFALAVAIYVGFSLGQMYGVACAALGMLSTLCIGLTIDAYGPISDNAGGIAEMAELGEDIRDITDALDAAGNTTAAIGKGFAIGSAALVSLALFGAFVTRAEISSVNIMKPFSFAGLLVGAMLPYWFSAMTMKSVGKAALDMVVEVRRQFATYPGIMDGSRKPDYAECVAISTKASLKEMLAPGALVIFSPIIFGFLFGKDALAGVLAGALVSGVQMAISMSNTGGAWDNAKKYVELGNHGGKGSDPHKAAVIGDTIGDPMKDTSGPSLNILIKLMAIISLVLAPFFQKLPTGILGKIFD